MFFICAGDIAGWSSSDDESGGWGKEVEEEEEEEEEEATAVMSDDEAFIRSLGLGSNKEGLIGDFSL